MSTMQAFYDQLSSDSDPYWSGLEWLTHLSIDQLKTLADELTWSIWGEDGGN